MELKKKYDDVVYKRRLAMHELDAMDWLCGGGGSGENSQIASEIDYFLKYYQTLRPTVFLSYEREAFYCRQGGDFRVTRSRCRWNPGCGVRPSWRRAWC